MRPSRQLDRSACNTSTTNPKRMIFTPTKLLTHSDEDGLSDTTRCFLSMTLLPKGGGLQRSIILEGFHDRRASIRAQQPAYRRR
jgi:hypothetical protein